MKVMTPEKHGELLVEENLKTFGRVEWSQVNSAKIKFNDHPLQLVKLNYIKITQ